VRSGAPRPRYESRGGGERLVDDDRAFRKQRPDRCCGRLRRDRFTRGRRVLLSRLDGGILWRAELFGERF
jgi:hypothetical protein